MNDRYSTGWDSRPIGKDWKSYWRAQEQAADPKQRRELRIEKRAARRRIHKAQRRGIRHQLKNWDPDEET